MPSSTVMLMAATSRLPMRWPRSDRTAPILSRAFDHVTEASNRADLRSIGREFLAQPSDVEFDRIGRDRLVEAEHLPAQLFLGHHLASARHQSLEKTSQGPRVFIRSKATCAAPRRITPVKTSSRPPSPLGVSNWPSWRGSANRCAITEYQHPSQPRLGHRRL